MEVGIVEYFVATGSKASFYYHMHLINPEWPKTIVAIVWLANSDGSNKDSYSYSYSYRGLDFKQIKDTNIMSAFMDSPDSLVRPELKEIKEQDNPELYKELQKDTYNFLKSYPQITTVSHSLQILEAKAKTYYYTKYFSTIIETANLKKKRGKERENYAEALFRDSCDSLDYEANINYKYAKQSFSNKRTGVRIGKCFQIEAWIEYPVISEKIYKIESVDSVTNYDNNLEKISYAPSYYPQEIDFVPYMEKLLYAMYNIHQDPINIFISTKSTTNNRSYLCVHSKPDDTKYLKNIII